MLSPFIINIVYIISSLLFAVGIKMLGSVETARKGNALSSLGMLLAVIVTLFNRGLSYEWIMLGIALGTIIGIVSAKKIVMTAMPQMVALLNGLGGLASVLVASSAYIFLTSPHPLALFTIFLSVLIGAVTFSGSIVAWAKLNGNISSKPFQFFGQKFINLLLVIALIFLGIIFTIGAFFPDHLFISLMILSLVLGVSFVLPIGGADMPVVISLLNSYSGLAACATGFVVENNILIVAGALVGASGIILTQIMCKAMNRSLKNVLFSGFGSLVKKSKDPKKTSTAKPITVEDAYFILEAAQSIVFVPGYGLAVAQAQHALQELGKILEDKGAQVKYAIHPVAGRMPGHMNVLLAEANVPYDQLIEMDAINPTMDTVEVCVVIGANDVVNPAALEDKTSPIYGMPIIEAHRAKTVFVLKRSMATGFAGIENDLFERDNTRMLFGDAKSSLLALVGQFKEK